MKPEKMTDAALNKLLTSMANAGSVLSVEMVRAHIAALTAEREHWKQESDAQNAAAIQYEPDVKRLRDELGRERAWKESARLERDALRERVQALEADLQHSRQSTGKALTEEREQADNLREGYESERNAREAAESRLAAIRQRAGDESALLRRAEVGAIMGAGSKDWDEEIHAEVVQRGDVETLRGAALAAAHYILGDDAPVDGAWEGPAYPSPERDPSDAPEDCAEPYIVEGGLKQVSNSEPTRISEPDPLCARCGGSGVDPGTSDPTTAEAFATVREAVEIGRSNVNTPTGEKAMDCALATLSLLERRMGAMAHVINRSIQAMESDSGDAPLARDFRDVLADAPPVFTLEEVVDAFFAAQKRMNGDDGIPDLREYLAGELTALRGGGR